MSASYEGLIETVPGINLEVLRMDKYEIEKEKDALFRGEFEVVKELVAALTDGDVRILYFDLSRPEIRAKRPKGTRKFEHIKQEGLQGQNDQI